MPVVVETDSTALAALLTALPTGTQGVESVERVRGWLGQHHDEYVVVLGPRLPLEEAVAVCEELRISRPTVSAILVREHLDTAVLTSAIKAGARDVVAVGDDAALGAAIARAHQLFVALRGPAGATRLEIGRAHV